MSCFVKVCLNQKINFFTPLVTATLVYLSVVDIQSMVIATDDDLPSKRGSPIMSTNSSSPLALKEGVAVSPIDVPEFDHYMETLDCDSLISNPERASGEERDIEEFPNLPIRTDEWKLYKVTHGGATYFLRAEKAQFSPESLPEKSLEISLVRNLFTNVVTCLKQIFYRWNVEAADLKCLM
jgi:hypothetical protein